MATVWLSPAATAAPGDHDPSYSTDGLATVWIKQGANAADAHVLPDERLLIVGCTRSFCGSSRIVLARLRTNGSPDRGFSGEGVALVDPFDGFPPRIASAVQPDGKIVITGSPELGQMTVARFHSDGSPDLDFGTDGVVVASEERVTAEDVAVAPDGTIVVVGVRLGTSGIDPLGDDVAVARFDPTGEVISDGIEVTNLGNSEWPQAVALTPDGGYVVAGGSSAAVHPGPTRYDFFAVRFDREGELDPQFGQGGVAFIDLGAADAARDVVVDGSGRPVLVGESSFGNDPIRSRFAVARLASDGFPDATFSGDGRLLGTFSADSLTSAGTGIAPTPDDGLLVAGTYHPAGAPFDDLTQIGVASIAPDGSLEDQFGRGGVVASSFPPHMAAVAALASPAGRLYAVGDAEYRRLAAVRYLTAGGPPDADADGHENRLDRCRSRFGRRHHGCPTNRQDVWFRYSGLFTALQGRVVSNEYGCSFGRRVAIFEKRPGSDRKLATRTTDDERGYFRVNWPRRRHGAYYAVTPKFRDPDFGICPGDTSSTVER